VQQARYFHIHRSSPEQCRQGRLSLQWHVQASLLAFSAGRFPLYGRTDGNVHTSVFINKTVLYIKNNQTLLLIPLVLYYWRDEIENHHFMQTLEMDR
jgi:hypothetical protein